jgi:CRP-like cAMP-binding protein
VTTKHVAPSSNKLLARLPAADYQRLYPHFETVPLPFKQVLHRGGEEVRRVYFPGGGVCSITHLMADGRTVEMATVGNEGFVGITACFGGGLEPGEAIVQMPDGSAQVLDVAVFKAEMERRGALYDVVNRYVQAYMIFLTQSVACNALHSVEERLARWLLMSHDRMAQDDFPLTQEFLAIMLGVRRSSVTLAFGALSRAGLIDHAAKKIRIKSRQGLEAASCECYATVAKHFASLLP